MYLPKNIGIKQKGTSKAKEGNLHQDYIEVAPYEQPLEQISPFFPILSGVDAIKFLSVTQDVISMGFRPEGMDYVTKRTHIYR